MPAKDFTITYKSKFGPLKYGLHLMYMIPKIYTEEEIICRCKKIHYIAKPFYCYRIHASWANSSAKIRRKHGLYLAWREHERVCQDYGIGTPLPYCRLRAQQAVISLLVLDAASKTLNQTQLADAQAYLKDCELHPAKELSSIRMVGIKKCSLYCKTFREAEFVG